MDAAFDVAPGAGVVVSNGFDDCRGRLGGGGAVQIMQVGGTCGGNLEDGELATDRG